ncbi:type VII secretion protein EccB [Actinocrinis puniceicyclus]|uniref:Type VII secretion protein EccB n=1 Tax=Actinocrinis puniceicyclus TaxID=977794 RepID=A0A8J7WSS2_9ACTN|nr:type VII secretion protein EccB [Actinocrinis puniceicyclus]MBS2965327.1 type VII secretion protein EccB [Actinocrinis puniceicyclus]
MATRKDQLDAFVFARRRMVSNLVAPSPTGSDESAPRPIKTFVTSAILSAIAVAGVAVLGVFKPSAPSGWESGLAVDSSSGAAYVYSPQDKELHPLLNITSARLLLGDKFKKFDVPDNVINGSDVVMGAPIGIPGAPQDVPTAGNVDLTQWTLCLDSANHGDQTQSHGKTILEVGYTAGKDSTASQYTAFVVHDPQNRNYLVTGDYAYPIQDNGVLNPLTSVFVGPDKAEGPWVSNAWLKAFRPGTPLQLPTVQGLGEPLGSLPNPQPGHHIGDYGTLPGANGQQVGYIETAGGLVEVNYFVYTLYKAGPAGSDSHARQIQLNESEIVKAAPKDELTSPTSLLNAGSDWPQNMVTTLDADGKTPGFGVLCVNFSASTSAGAFDGDLPHLTLLYGDQLPQSLPNGVTVQGTGQDVADYVLVKAGHAALAQDVSGGNNKNSGPEYLVTETGIRYLMTSSAKLPGAGADAQPVSAAHMLQYDKVQVTPVPSNWIRLVRPGADLNPTDAGKSPPLAAD